MLRSKKRLLIIGSGGREHALAWKLSQSPQVEKIFVAPGNGGTTSMPKVHNVDIAVTDFGKLTHLAYQEDISLTIVGPDDPLAAGIVDVFQARGLKIFGPTEAAAQIESSKAFAKNLMDKAQIPTAAYKVFSCASESEDLAPDWIATPSAMAQNDIMKQALEYCEIQGFPIVIKASGLALGKGVMICRTLTEAQTALQKILIEKIFGDAGNQVVIEAYLEGPEISVHAISDGLTYKLFPPAQDHKAIYDGDLGPNTGGMGTIAPLAYNLDDIEKQIIEPCLKALPFTGLLFPGLMMTQSGPQVLEFNARFGDPETQVYMRLLKTDLYEIINACVNNKLADIEIEWNNKFAACIILASGGYPDAYEKGFEISGIADAQTDPDVVVFHAGTRIDYKSLSEKLVTNGGRVLGVTAMADSLEDALAKAYKAVDKINFQNKYYRKDIGAKYLKSHACLVS